MVWKLLAHLVCIQKSLINMTEELMKLFFTGLYCKTSNDSFLSFLFLIVERMKNSSHYFGIDFCLL